MSNAKRLARIFIPRKARNWLRSPSESLQWAWAQAKHLAGQNEVVQVRPDWRLVCHPAANRFSYVAQNNDEDQVAEFDSFIKEIVPGTVLFDIGAHFGLFSLAAIHYGGAHAVAVAVDPSPMAIEFIKTQAKLNQVSEQLHTVQAAVSDKVGWQSMVAAGVRASGYYVQPASDHSRRELTNTRTTTLDQLVSDFGLQPTHVKVDVEGYELSVIKGGNQLLSGVKAPLLFLELHNEIVRGNNGAPEKTLDLIRSLNYETFSTSGELLNDQEILASPLIRIVARKS